jgi:hypothetical protein
MTQPKFVFACFTALLTVASGSASAQPSPGAVAGFSSYIGRLEGHFAVQRWSPVASLGAQDDVRLRQGELVVKRLTPTSGDNLPGALLHDWSGTAFVPGAKAEDFQRLMENYGAYPQVFSSQVLRARVLERQGDQFQVVLRVRQHHVITVVLDITSNVHFVRMDTSHGYSISRSTNIVEIDDGRALSPDKSHGFLWRINTYWSYEERDGGLYMRIESVSLTRAIPRGLGWAVGPYLESIPRESLEFTLRSVCDALRKQGGQK